MDVGRQNQKESWIPQSHFRHILPRVIYTDRQGNQLDQASSSEIKGLSGLGECCPPSSSNWEAAARGAEKGSAGNDCVETSRECSTGNTATWNPMSLDDPLLALADAASREHLNPWIIGNYTQEPKCKHNRVGFRKNSFLYAWLLFHQGSSLMCIHLAAKYLQGVAIEIEKMIITTNGIHSDINDIINQ